MSILLLNCNLWAPDKVNKGKDKQDEDNSEDCGKLEIQRSGKLLLAKSLMPNYSCNFIMKIYTILANYKICQIFQAPKFPSIQ